MPPEGERPAHITALLEKYAAGGRGLKRGQWAQFTAMYTSALSFEAMLKDYCRENGESATTRWGEPTTDSQITVYYRIGKKRGPKT